jgi:hypothetical protein
LEGSSTRKQALYIKLFISKYRKISSEKSKTEVPNIGINYGEREVR